MRLTTICDHGSEKLMVGPITDHGDFPFRLFLRVQYNDGVWEGLGKYIVTIGCVSPDAAGEDGCKRVRDWVGMQEEEWSALDHKYKCEVMIRYGRYVTFGQWNGNNLRKLLQHARGQLRQDDFMFGFAMDRPQNALGATGWDVIRGNLCPSKSS